MNYINIQRVLELSERANKFENPAIRLFPIFLKAQEELGEFSDAIENPGACDEHYSGEFADLMLALYDFYLTKTKSDGIPKQEALFSLQQCLDSNSQFIEDGEQVDVTKVVQTICYFNDIKAPSSRLFPVFLKAQKALGIFATAINIPEKCNEHYSAKFADVTHRLLDLYLTKSKVDGVSSQVAIDSLNALIETKSKKWEKTLEKKEALSEKMAATIQA